jgi:hypothetical protein
MDLSALMIEAVHTSDTWIYSTGLHGAISQKALICNKTFTLHLTRGIVNKVFKIKK